MSVLWRRGGGAGIAVSAVTLTIAAAQTFRDGLGRIPDLFLICTTPDRDWN